MKTKLTEKLATVMIPTHNRPVFLQRSLEYWGQSNYNVFIADSSTERYREALPANCHYEHMPNVEYYTKCLEIVRKIDSKYIVPCADDDFHALGGVDSAIKFLETHPSYSTAKGRSIDFIFRNGELETYPIYTSDRDVGDKSLELRMQNSLFPWISNVWAGFRKEIYQLCKKYIPLAGQ